MKFIADTSVWSLFLRRHSRSASKKLDVLRQGIQDGQVIMLGIIRQELLSGIREEAQYERVEVILEGFPDVLATSQDHLLAAQLYNRCRRAGVQGSPVDFLICAQAVNHHIGILTTDRDFNHYAKHISIELI